jgi:uncharacterized protein YbjT (DUF2867 family)
LRDWGAELVYGDLSVPETIPKTLKNVQTIIDASTARPTDDYNVEKIDWQGKVALMEAAKLAKVDKFIFFSVLGAAKNKNIPLLDLKVKIVNYLKTTNINYTIFECSGFFQGLINQYAVPTLEKQTIWLFGETTRTLYIDTQEAARVVVNNLKKDSVDNEIIKLIGPKAWSPEEIIQLCERLSGQKAKISYLPLIFLSIVKIILRSLEFTWNIVDRLQFSEITEHKLQSDDISLGEDTLSLEQYLKEYFSRILKKLKEANYQQTQSDISFL